MKATLELPDGRIIWRHVFEMAHNLFGFERKEAYAQATYEVTVAIRYQIEALTDQAHLTACAFKHAPDLVKRSPQYFMPWMEQQKDLWI